MFIALFGAILRLRNILTSFDEFAGNEILSERDYQDYQSFYLDLYAELRVAVDAEKESIIDDVVFEIELVKQVEVNVDYILMLVEKYREERGDGSDRELEALAKIRRAIDSSISLRNKRDLILAFVDSVSVTRTSRRTGAVSSRPGGTRSSTRSSRTKGSTPTRPARSSRGHFVTVRSQQPAQRSPRSSRRPRASRRTTATDSRSRPCSTGSQRSSTGTSLWGKFSDRSCRVCQRPASCVQLPREERRVRGRSPRERGGRDRQSGAAAHLCSALKAYGP